MASIFKVTWAKLLIVALLLAAIGVVLARLWCPSATERANAITLEDIERDIKDYETSKKLAKAVEELAETRPGSAEREEKLNALINLLEPDTQRYIRSLPREDRLESITKKIREGSAAKERALAGQKLREKLCWWR